MKEEKALSFNVEGEFITQLAKEWLFYEGKEFKKVMELLLSCMCGTDMSEKTLKWFAEDVLIGRAVFSGSTADDTFCMKIYEPDEQPEIPKQFDIFHRFVEEVKKRKNAEKEKEKYAEWYAVAMEYVPEYLKNQVRKKTGQPIESRYGSNMLSGFMERMLDEEKHSTEDYGWLAPDGTFHEVEWGEHQEWAQNYIEEHFPEVADDSKVDMQVKCNVGLIGAGDWLVKHGWVLLHNPSQGIAFPTKNPVKRYTKAQKEFLYDYYMERGKEKEANAIYKGEE